MIGQTLSHYQVLEKIGEGGMGVVYKARDTLLSRLVALKTLPSGGPADPERQARLLREARAASALHHPNIVAVHDLLHHDGSDVIVMELVTGQTLDRAVAGKGLREVLGYARQIADALAKAHSAGIIHRDLKPSNVMVDESGRVRILDFGLARLGAPPGTIDFGSVSTSPTAEATETAEGRIVGTLAYMSPEQAEGKKADARSDVFSFGAVLYEMVTGRMAFRRDSAAATLAAVLERDPPPPCEIVPGLPHDLEKLIQRCLRKDPAKRVQSMGDVALDLDELAAGLDTAQARPRRGGISRRAGRVLATTTALALVGVVGWLLRRGPASSPPASTVTQLTSYPGTEVAPSFSPDGTQVAFSWNGETRDNPDIYVKLIGSGGPPLRLTTHPASDNFPAWSPDGRHIAFRRTSPPPGVAGPRQVSVYVLPALGGPERKVADVPYVRLPFLSWTPNGKWLAAPGVGPAGGNGIFLFPVEEGEQRRLTSNPADVDSCPALSPDGRFLAYASCSATYTCDVRVLELDTDHRPKGAPRRLTREGLVISGIAWSAEGRDLVYSASREGANAPYLWRIAATGGGAPERIEVAGTPASNPTVARFGDRLAYTRGTSDDDIWKVEVGKPAEPLILSTRSDRSPHFSPDGKRIAFCSDRGTAALEIFVARAEGTHPIQLTDGLGREQCSPRWSPDGRRIVFDSQASDGTWDIFVIDAAGGPPRRLAPGPSAESLPSWSSDGRWVYFTSNRSGRPEVWRVAAEGGAPARVTDDGGVTSLESTDGRTLYYVKERTPAQPLFARPVGGGAERQVVDEILGRTFAVAKDGVYYFARTETAVAASLRHLDVATGRTTEITRVDRVPSLGITVSPDRKTILFGVFKPPDNDLYLIENFR